MVDEKNAQGAKEPPAKVQPSTHLGPNEAHAEAEKKDVKEGGPTGIPKRGKMIKITALGTNQRVVKGKLVSNRGTFVTPEGEGWNHGLVEEIRRDSVVSAGFAIENFEDGELVLPKR